MQELVRRYHAGTFVFREGELGEYAFVVRTGKIRLFRVDGPREIDFGECLDGRLFGEAALVERQPRGTNAVAVTGSECFAIDRRDYLMRMAKLDGRIGPALRNLHIFVHRVPLFDRNGKRVVGVASAETERAVASLLDSDLGTALARTGDPVVDLVAEQLVEEARRRLPAPPEDPETHRQRDRLKPKAAAPEPARASPPPAAKPAAAAAAKPATPSTPPPARGLGNLSA